MDSFVEIERPVTSYPVSGTKTTTGPTTIIAAPGVMQQIIIDGITIQAEADGDQLILLANTAGTVIQRLFTTTKAQGISRSHLRWPQGANVGVSLSLNVALKVGYTIYYHVERVS